MKNKRIFVFATISTLFLTLLPLAIIQPTFGYVTTTVPGGAITYYSRGNCSIDITSLNFILGNGYHVPTMYLQATHYVASTNGGSDYNTFMISIQVTSTGVVAPLGIFTTTDTNVDFLQNAFRGTPAYRPGPPALNNIHLLGQDELQVTRHGNTIIADFTPKNTMTLYMSANTYPAPLATKPLVIPAFHIEFNKYGDSVYSDFYQTTLRPYSGYVVHYSFTGFSADATFTSSNWNMNEVAGQDAFITMHGNQTWIPGPIGPA